MRADPIISVKFAALLNGGGLIFEAHIARKAHNRCCPRASVRNSPRKMNTRTLSVVKTQITEKKKLLFL
jgi:hypothetical protein